MAAAGACEHAQLLPAVPPPSPLDVLSQITIVIVMFHCNSVVTPPHPPRVTQASRPHVHGCCQQCVATATLTAPKPQQKEEQQRSTSTQPTTPNCHLKARQPAPTPSATSFSAGYPPKQYLASHSKTAHTPPGTFMPMCLPHFLQTPTLHKTSRCLLQRSPSTPLSLAPPQEQPRAPLAHSQPSCRL